MYFSPHTKQVVLQKKGQHKVMYAAGRELELTETIKA